MSKIYAFIIRSTTVGSDNKKDNFMPRKIYISGRTIRQHNKYINNSKPERKKGKKKQINSRVTFPFSSLCIRLISVLLFCLPFNARLRVETEKVPFKCKKYKSLFNPSLTTMMMMMDVFHKMNKKTFKYHNSVKASVKSKQWG